MSEYPTLNRQARRSIEALQNALIDLAKVQPYQKITITSLAKRSGLTRSTFYAHFETKDQLLESILNNVLDRFFSALQDFHGGDSQKELVLESDKSFFQVWEQNQDLIPLLESVDFGCLVVARLRAYWESLYRQNVRAALPAVAGNYSAYSLNFLAFAFTGFLKEWILQGMQPPAELMGEMLYHFTGPEVMLSAREKFQSKFARSSH